MEIEHLIKDNDKDEKKKILSIRKQNDSIIKKFETMKNLSDDTIDMIEKKMKKKKEEIDGIFISLYQNKKQFNKIIENLSI